MIPTKNLFVKNILGLCNLLSFINFVLCILFSFSCILQFKSIINSVPRFDYAQPKKLLAKTGL